MFNKNYYNINKVLVIMMIKYEHNENRSKSSLLTVDKRLILLFRET